MADPDDATNEPTAEPPTTPASDVQAEILAAMDGSTLAEAESGESGQSAEASSEDAAGDDAAADG